jgi:hypothetical protein
VTAEGASGSEPPRGRASGAPAHGGKTAAEKMRMKAGMTAAFPHAPAEVVERLGLPDGVTVSDDPRDAQFVLVAAHDQVEAEERLRGLVPLVDDERLVWIVYPKGSRAAGRDVSRDTIWASARALGLDLVANVSVDETWSALRLKPAR